MKRPVRTQPRPVRRVGRPTSYRPEYAEQIYKLHLLNSKITDAGICDFFDITEATLQNWKRANPQFLNALRRGKEEADLEVVSALRKRATGFTHPEEKILVVDGKVERVKTSKYYPPDHGSAALWLKNRHPHIWRDRHEVTGADGAPLVDFSKLSPNELAAFEQLITRATTGDLAGPSSGETKTRH